MKEATLEALWTYLLSFITFELLILHCPFWLSAASFLRHPPKYQLSSLEGYLQLLNKADLIDTDFHLRSQRALTNPQTKKMSRMICQAHVLVQYDPIHPKKFQNRALRGFCTICIFVFFHWFSLGPTGIKGATDQMLPWKAPNGPKTLPMGILQDYMSCWTTLGPFQRATGAP